MITFTNGRLDDLLKQVIAHEDLKLTIYSDVAWVVEGILDGKGFSFNPSDADNDLVEIVLGSIDAIVQRGYIGQYPKVVRTSEGLADVDFHQGRFCLSERVETGPYCPMYGGFGETLEEAITDFEGSVRGDDKPEFAITISDVGSQKLAVVAYVKDLLVLSSSDALKRVNSGVIIDVAGSYTCDIVRPALEERGATVVIEPLGTTKTAEKLLGIE